MFEPDGRDRSKRTAPRIANKSGQTMIMLTVAFGTMIAMLGLVFDGGRIYYEKRRLQAAADAGAFAAVQELRRGHRNGELQVKPAARRDVELNGYTANNATITVDYPGPGGANQVVVTVESVVPTTFMRIVNRTSSTVGARAVGAILIGGDPCIMALREGNDNGTLKVTGGAEIRAECGLYVNSNGNRALEPPNGGGNGSIIKANWAGVVGGHAAGNYDIEYGIRSDNEGDDMAPMSDPFAGVEEMNDPMLATTLSDLSAKDARGYCDEDGTQVRSNGNGPNNCSTIYYVPGRYQQDISPNSNNGTAIFAPGLYNIVGGMTFSASWNVSGDGVTFYFNGGGSPSKGVQFSTSGLVELSAPTAEDVLIHGGIQGVLFFGAKSNNYNNATNRIGRAQNGSYFSGMIYFPSEHLDWAGNSDTFVNAGADSDLFSMVIANTIDLSGGSGLTVFRKPSSIGAAPKIYRAVLVE